MIRRAVVAMFALALVGQPAAASEQKKPEERVCKQEKKTGSQMTRKVCWTAEDWKHMTRETQQAKDAMGRMGSEGSYNGQGVWRGPG